MSNLMYVCSPLRASTREETQENMLAARFYCKLVDAVNIGVKAIAPHAWLPEMLDDDYPEERELALDIGLMLLKKCCGIAVFGNRLSGGMRKEIRLAVELNKPVFIQSDKVYKQLLAEEIIAKARIYALFLKDMCLKSVA